MHQIRRQIIELDLPWEEGSLALEQRVSSLFRDNIHPRLERLFDELDIPGQTIRIEQLILDLGELPPEALERGFVERFLQKVEIQIREQITRSASAGDSQPEYPAENQVTELLSPPEFESPSSTLPDPKTGRPILPDNTKPGGSPTRLTDSERNWEIVLFFLAHGHLPWFAAGQSWVSELKDFLAAQMDQSPTRTVNRLRFLIRESAIAVERLVYQFSPVLATKILEACLELPAGFWFDWQQKTEAINRKAMSALQIAKIWKHILLELSATPEIAKTNTWAAQAERVFNRVWTTINEDLPVAKSEQVIESPVGTSSGAIPSPVHQADTGTREKLQASPAEASSPVTERKKTDLNEAAPLPVKPPAASGEQPEMKQQQPAANTAAPKRAQAPSPDQETGLYIQNAGLILLHPYLKIMFERTGLLTDKTFSGMEAQWRAAHLLEYLATGLQMPDEGALVLNKILCGMSIGDPVPLEIELKETETREADELLEAVLSHWSALKNTSIDGLRNGFLQRAGQLRFSTDRDGWLLQVETKGQDVLLSRLPWGYSVVKLPWMEQVLFAEWGHN
jgi:hypothetical protein